MKFPVLLLLFLSFTFTSSTASAQNVSLNILTQNAGTVNIGGSVYVEITLANTSSSVAVPVNKVRPQISVPTSIVSIPASGHQLPAGWSIISNAGGVIRLCNGSDAIPPNTARTALIAIQGNTLGGPFTISGNTTFANGTVCGTSGGATSGDAAGDNTSTSTIQVFDPIPVVLRNFNASMINCLPVLTWQTESEINSDRYEIETSKSNTGNWTLLKTLPAKGYSSTKSNYRYTDLTTYTNNENILYRIKMIDRDGKYSYTEVLSVKPSCNSIEAGIFPNPVRDGNLNIKLKGFTYPVEVSLYAESGQLVSKHLLFHDINHIKLANTPPGSYSLKLVDASGNERIIKVMVQH